MPYWEKNVRLKIDSLERSATPYEQLESDRAENQERRQRLAAGWPDSGVLHRGHRAKADNGPSSQRRRAMNPPTPI